PQQKARRPMAVKIKLTRLGKIRNPQYRIMVADARTRRDGRGIENIGLYRPKENPSFIEIDSERAQYWLSVGAQPTESVEQLLKVTGDWQKFKGIEGADGSLKVAEPQPSKLDRFNKALEVACGWPEFKGIEGADGTLKVAGPQASKLGRFNTALEGARGEPSAEAITSKRKAEKAKKAEEAEAGKKAEEEAAKAAESAAES